MEPPHRPTSSMRFQSSAHRQEPTQNYTYPAPPLMESQKLPQMRTTTSQAMSEPGLNTWDNSYQHNTYNERSTTLDDLTNLRHNQQSEYHHGSRAPLGAWFNDPSTTGVIIPHDSRLGQGHPTTRTEPIHNTAYSQDGSHVPAMVIDTSTIETESVNSDRYGSSYHHRSATTSWNGSPPNKPTYLGDDPMNRRQGPSDNSECAWGDRYTHPTVNPAEVNSQSAGASEDTEMPDEEHFNGAPQIYINDSPNLYGRRLPPPPQEVEESTKLGIDYNESRVRSVRSEHNHRHTHPSRGSGTHLELPTRGSGRGSGRKPAPRKPDTNRVSKHPLKGNSRRQTTANSSRQQRPFLCTFYFANCVQTFATKNEWKRHVSSQHLQTNIWRCDYPSCSERKAATFNRKDLFGQHLKRMHAPSGEQYGGQSARSSKNNRKNHTPEMAHFLNTEIPRIQERCRKERRQPPQRSMCGFTNCRQIFDGHGSWEERMEHVGRHYENAAASGEDVGPENWVMDPSLIDWAVRENLVIRSSDSSYQCTNVGKGAVMDAIAFQ